MAKKKMNSIHTLMLNEIKMSAADSGSLGHSAAVVIECASANTSPLNLPRTLQELGLDGISFQGAVFNGVRKAGCTIDIDAIPDSPDTDLIQVVNVIQNAPAA